MTSATEERTASPLRIALPLAGAVAGLIGLAYLYAAITMKPVEWGPTVFGILGGGSMLPVSLILSRGKRPIPLPDPWRSEIQEALSREGLVGWTLTYGATEPTSSFPRPMVIGGQFMLSQRVLREFSRPALLWSVQTDALAQRWFVRRALPAFFVALVVCFLSTAFMKRWSLSDAWLALPASCFVASFVGLARYGYVLQIQADRRFTRTDEDRKAAREALGIPYHAQKSRPRGQKWMFPAAELRGRARRLGIDLDAEVQPATERMPA